MNLQPQPRTDLVLPHPHSTCALRGTHTLHPRLSSRSSDLTRPISGHRLPQFELSERYKTPTSRDWHPLKPIQRP
jgi:hypothetical protein